MINLATNESKEHRWTLRLRTGLGLLNQYLERFNIIDETEYECKQGKETVRHFLLVCQKHERRKKGIAARPTVDWRKYVDAVGIALVCDMRDQRSCL